MANTRDPSESRDMEEKQLNTKDGFIVVNRISVDEIEIRIKDMTEARSTIIVLDNRKLAYLKAIINEFV